MLNKERTSSRECQGIRSVPAHPLADLRLQLRLGIVRIRHNDGVSGLRGADTPCCRSRVGLEGGGAASQISKEAEGPPRDPQRSKR